MLHISIIQIISSDIYRKFGNVMSKNPGKESLKDKALPNSDILLYFLDVKTAGSAGSLAAHQIYRLKTEKTRKEKRLVMLHSKSFFPTKRNKNT